MRFWGFFCFFILVAGMAAAQQFPAGQCAVVVASRPTLVEAQNYRANHPDYRISEIYLSKNGWYALIVDRINRDDANSILNRRKSAGLIPDDSYCSSGRLFVQRVWSQANRLPSPPPVPASGLFAEFDARSLGIAEKRFLQASLSLSGDYDGRLDGKWGRNSQASLERWSLREFGAMPLNLHGALVASYGASMLDDGGWDTYTDPVLRVSLQLPFNAVQTDNGGSAGLDLKARDGSFGVVVGSMTDLAARSFHDRLISGVSASFPTSPYLVRNDDFWVTAFSDGVNRFYGRTDFDHGMGFARTGFFTAQSETGYALSNLVIASYQMGPQPDLTLPSDGVLMGLVRAALAETKGEGGQVVPAPVAPPVAAPDEPVETQKSPSRVSSGSGFYINAIGSVMTNAHVIDGCSALTVAGRHARLVAVDKQLDLAVINVDGGIPAGAETLSFAAKPERLNADVTVAGYPLNGLLDTLNVTRGSVSALKGLDNNATELQITAPVQPGNSGGPIVDRYGQIIGVVVAKINGLYVVNATGDIPQNINFGIRGSIARIFAEANGIAFSQTDESEVLAPEDLAERLQKATVLVECF